MGSEGFLFLFFPFHISSQFYQIGGFFSTMSLHVRYGMEVGSVVTMYSFVNPIYILISIVGEIEHVKFDHM